MITYVDASVVLRRVLGEADPLAGWEELEPVSSELIRAECLRTLDRYRLVAPADAVEPERRAAVIDTLRTFDLFAVSSAVLERAGDPFPVVLGTLDAIHLATALIAREEVPDLEFATHDAKLASAARSMGFVVRGVPESDTSLETVDAEAQARAIILATADIGGDNPDWPEWQRTVRGRTASARLDDSSS